MFLIKKGFGLNIFKGPLTANYPYRAIVYPEMVEFNNGSLQMFSWVFFHMRSLAMKRLQCLLAAMGLRQLVQFARTMAVVGFAMVPIASHVGMLCMLT